MDSIRKRILIGQIAIFAMITMVIVLTIVSWVVS
jgi:sensor domain CHASE-containing protein